MNFAKLLRTPIFHRTLPVAASDFSGNLQVFKKGVFCESLHLKLPVTFPEIFFMKICSTNVLLIKVLFLFKRM